MPHPLLLSSLPARAGEDRLVNVVVETPRGGRNKYSYDEESGAFRLKKVLPLGMSFPFDFGFVPSTLAEDGDPLDILVLMDEPAAVGTLVLARAIGVVEAEQSEAGKMVRNDRLLGVAEPCLRYEGVRGLGDLRPRLLDEIEQFFVSYNRLGGTEFRPIGRKGADRALELIEQAAASRRR